jgi:hypothetical protein
MNQTEEIILSDIRKNLFLKTLLLCYPLPYRKRFENEMLFLFSDMYQEELRSYGKIRAMFWLNQTADITKSILQQHGEYLMKYGMKKYTKKVLHITKYNVLGFIFLLPFGIILFTDLAARILQGDMLHPNHSVLHGLYNSPFYWFPILFTWIFLFPIFSVIISFIPLIKNLLSKRRKFSAVTFLQNNSITITILSTAISVILLVKFHDFFPCFINQIRSLGISHISAIYTFCQNA